MTDIVTFQWNPKANAAGQGRRVVEKLDRWLHDHRVQVATLTEVKGAYDHLHDWCRTNGFTIGQERGTRDPADERGDTALLLRVKGPGKLEVERQWPAFMSEEWEVFDHNQVHDPRRHRRAVFRTPDRTRIRWAGDHWPTRGNREAWDESRAIAAAFLERPGIAILAGDLNAERDDALELTQMARGSFDGKQPDWIITNRQADIQLRNLGAGGSDHDALLATLTL